MSYFFSSRRASMYLEERTCAVPNKQNEQSSSITVKALSTG